MDFYSKEKKNALEAKHHAQLIAFGPVIFQVARALRDLGILSLIEGERGKGITLDELVARTGLSRYGVRVLLESGLGIGLVLVNDEKYTITRTGYFILHDNLTRVNMNFVQDVCYHGLSDLEASVRNEKPEGLKVFGEWKTVYAALASLPDDVRKSWFEFDHFFSDMAFPETLPHVYDGKIKNLLDIGGNTGKWAIASTLHDPNVHVTIMDLPGQLKDAEKKVREKGLQDRVSFHEGDLLDEKNAVPKGFDAIWMSQFLDCFSEAEIASILKRCAESMDEGARLYILEAFWDRQRFETAAFCLQQTSIYFTAIANGNSQMYDSRVFNAVVRDSGFEIVQEVDDIGLSHTLLTCVKKK